MLLLRTTRLLIFNNISYQHVYSEQKNCWILGKTNIFSTLHQFSYLSLKNASDMYPSTNIHALFNRFAHSTCLLDFIFCPSNMFIPTNTYYYLHFCPSNTLIPSNTSIRNSRVSAQWKGKSIWSKIHNWYINYLIKIVPREKMIVNSKPHTGFHRLSRGLRY